MCSVQCPCLKDEVKPWTDLDESYLNEFTRTKQTDPAKQPEGTVRISPARVTGDDERDFFPETFFDCFFEWQAEFVEAGSVEG